jgi:anti-anti-sigma factor
MGIALEKNDGNVAIALDGAIDIGCAAELKKSLLDAFQSGNEIRVSLAGVTFLDVTAVQLLWAAKRRAETSGIEFQFQDPVPEAVSTALADAGFSPFLVSVATA